MLLSLRPFDGWFVLSQKHQLLLPFHDIWLRGIVYDLSSLKLRIEIVLFFIFVIGTLRTLHGYMALISDHFTKTLESSAISLPFLVL